MTRKEYSGFEGYVDGPFIPKVGTKRAFVPLFTLNPGDTITGYVLSQDLRVYVGANINCILCMRYDLETDENIYIQGAFQVNTTLHYQAQHETDLTATKKSIVGLSFYQTGVLDIVPVKRVLHAWISVRKNPKTVMEDE